MEPFISRDGAYLFFNDSGSDKDIYYATYIDDTTFQFQGDITDINTAAVDGVPTMDNLGKFYYVSTATIALQQPMTLFTPAHGRVVRSLAAPR